MSRVERDDRRAKKGVPSRATEILSKINSDIRALNSSILVLSQKMKYVVRNEKILGRNLLVLNKKLKGLESGGLQGGVTTSGEVGSIRNELANLNSVVSKQSELLSEMQSAILEMNDKFAKQEELKEIKYVIDAINPLEFVTRGDLEKLIENKLKGKRRK